jgi:hypothetical protein
MPSKNKYSDHYGRLHAWVKFKCTKSSDGDYFLALSVVDSGCECIAFADKTCWHVGAVCVGAENIKRPPASLVPESSTAKTKAWNVPKEDRVNKYDVNMPLNRLPTGNNKDRNGDAKLKSPNRVRHDAGNGGRFAGEWRSCDLGVEHKYLRNDPAVIAGLKDLYSKSVSDSGRSVVAAVHWPAEELDLESFKTIPICDREYLMGGKPAYKCVK